MISIDPHAVIDMLRPPSETGARPKTTVTTLTGASTAAPTAAPTAVSTAASTAAPAASASLIVANGKSHAEKEEEGSDSDDHVSGLGQNFKKDQLF